MPRKISKEKQERPAYLSPDGTIDFSKVFVHQPKQKELLRNVSISGHTYTMPKATQSLSVGGIRSGKTVGVLMFFVMQYCMKWAGCDLLVLRRTFPELENGAIKDFLTFMPKELYKYDQTKHIATLTNGSRVVFGHCQNNKERDIEKYLGQAFPCILVDEAGQFSPDAWMMLHSRNTLNPACQPDEYGVLPVPCMWGCTNPLGPFYEFYRTVFIQGEPWNKPEDARKDATNGTWWVQEGGEWRLIHDPNDYAYQRSTVLDNPELLKRDPGIIARLNAMPKAKRDKLLLGLDGNFEGQYFDVWDPTYHVINLREDPEAITWLDWQPVWVGQDWGMGHANASYFFTKALVKLSVGDDYKLKTVCFAELVTTGGKTYQELALMLSKKAKRPDGKAVDIKNIFFSHEKFNRQMGAHSPADDYSRELRTYGMPPVTRGTTDRIGSASLMYNMLKKGDLVIVDTCTNIILAIPTLMRDPDNLDDVFKTEAKGDDCYDGFRLGLYGQLATKPRPEQDIIDEHAKTLDPIARHFYMQKKARELAERSVMFKPKSQPMWRGKMGV